MDSYSKPDVPPVALLRDADGKMIASLEKADISKLTDSGWKPPVPFTVKGRDGLMSEVVLLEGSAGEARGHETAFCGIYAPEGVLQTRSRLTASTCCIS